MKTFHFRGFSGLNENASFSDRPTSANEISNFKINENGSLETIDSITKICDVGHQIKAMWSGRLGYEDVLIFIAGGKIYRMSLPLKTYTPSYMDDIDDADEYLLFYFNDYIYIMTDEKYYKFDGSELYEVEGYIPLVALSCHPNGSGEIFEQINLICDKRRQLFSSDGTSKEYVLAEDDIDKILSVKIDNMLTNNFTFSENKRSIVFSAIPKEGTNNVEIIYSKANTNLDRGRIMNCKKAMVFGGNSNGRVFLWGNKYYPNYRFYSEVANGLPSVEYFPVNAFTVIGNSKINCIVQQYNRQLIFCEKEAYYSYCELREDELGNTVSSFPVFSMNGSKGSLIETDGCIIDNRPITLCDDGLNMWESTSVQDEKNAVCFSNPISKTLKTILSNLQSKILMFDFQANRELFFVCGDKIYIYNYANGSWYMYTKLLIDKKTVFGKMLFYSHENAVYVFGSDIVTNDDNSCIWKSNPITFGESSGRFDIVSCEADIHVRGPIQLSFSFSEDGSISEITRTFAYDNYTNNHIRIAFRPSIKRSMPIKMNIKQSGIGKVIIYGLTIKIRKHERSLKLGLR